MKNFKENATHSYISAPYKGERFCNTHGRYEKVEENKAGTPARIVMKVFEKGKKVKRYYQTKQREFRWYFNRAKLKNNDKRVFFCCEYVPEDDGRGKIRMLTNSKDCYNVDDLKWCYQAFYKEYLYEVPKKVVQTRKPKPVNKKVGQTVCGRSQKKGKLHLRKVSKTVRKRRQKS